MTRRGGDRNGLEHHTRTDRGKTERQCSGLPLSTHSLDHSSDLTSMTEPESVPIIKRRSRPQPRQRQLSIEVDEPDAPQEEQGEDGEQIE